MFPVVITTGNMKSKAIQIVPDAEKSAKIDKLASQLRKSRAAVCDLAVDTLLPLLESGAWVVLNGKAMPKDKASEALVAA